MKVKVNLENEYAGADFEKLFPFDVYETAVQVVRAVLESEGCPYPASVELLLTDDEGIREANRENREIDRVTDVLSFPVCEYEVPADFKEAEEDPFGCFDPEDGCLLLGDIMISVPKAYAQSAEYGHSVKREFAFLTAHSVLHLIGYDHMTDPEADVMFQKQEAVLTSLGITREE